MSAPAMDAETSLLYGTGYSHLLFFRFSNHWASMRIRTVRCIATVSLLQDATTTVGGTTSLDRSTDPGIFHRSTSVMDLLHGCAGEIHQPCQD